MQRTVLIITFSHFTIRGDILKFIISQPMNGLSKEEIHLTRDRAKKHLEQLGYDVIGTLYELDPPLFVKISGLYHLGLVFLAMSHCDGVFFCNGWENARGCRIEHEAAVSYGLQIIYE